MTITTIAAQVQTWTGTPRNQPVPKYPNVLPRPVMAAPPVQSSVRPRAMVSIAKVATKGGILKRVIINPLKNPRNEPVTNPAITAPSRVKPMKRLKAGNSKPFLSKPAMIAPLRARIDPTDRSIPPVRITSVIPTERHVLTETCLKTSQKLSSVKKPSAQTLKITTISNRANSDWNRTRIFLWSFNSSIPEPYTFEESCNRKLFGIAAFIINSSVACESANSAVCLPSDSTTIRSAIAMISGNSEEAMTMARPA